MKKNLQIPKHFKFLIIKQTANQKEVNKSAKTIFSYLGLFVDNCIRGYAPKMTVSFPRKALFTHLLIGTLNISLLWQPLSKRFHKRNEFQTHGKRTDFRSPIPVLLPVLHCDHILFTVCMTWATKKPTDRHKNEFCNP